MCDFRHDSGRTCTFLPYWEVSVLSMAASPVEAQLACKRHLSPTCELLYLREARRGTRLMVTPL